MDTSGFESLRPPPDLLDDPGRVEREAEEQGEALRRLRQELAGLTGRATSDDGTITAIATDVELRELQLDPKAMRKPSVDLAEEIVAVARAAREDFERRRRELTAELGVATPPQDLDAALAQMRQVGEAFSRGSGDVQALVEQFLRRAPGGR
ncbi:YbaB/EbfC family nucleoid-associated protein [Nocardioides litoris]|uniref:YbaB/EbfC family nucleoid-associated protein n=1 Tax=Nocardioides litoris TaxID=1926648 RepID=UPI0011230B37|nr:YbaB/EbfC family nucleoid-associated protein [Nocardioides litoris]